VAGVADITAAGVIVATGAADRATDQRS